MNFALKSFTLLMLSLVSSQNFRNNLRLDLSDSSLSFPDDFSNSTEDSPSTLYIYAILAAIIFIGASLLVFCFMSLKEEQLPSVYLKIV